MTGRQTRRGVPPVSWDRRHAHPHNPPALLLHAFLHNTCYDRGAPLLFFFQSFSRVGSRGFQNLAGRVGSGHNILKSHASGRVGSRGFKISRVGSGRVNKLQNSRGSGRVGSGQEVISRVGSVHDPRDSDHSRVGSVHDPRDTGHSRVKP